MRLVDPFRKSVRSFVGQDPSVSGRWLDMIVSPEYVTWIQEDGISEKPGRASSVPSDYQLATEQNRLQTRLIELKVQAEDTYADRIALRHLHADLEVVRTEIMRRARDRHPSSKNGFGRPPPPLTFRRLGTEPRSGSQSAEFA
jgi:hypothetical protein